MEITYRIYGHCLRLNFINDLELLPDLDEFVGKPVDNKYIVSGMFMFEKKSVEFLDEYYREMNEEYKDFQKVYVQPTGEYAEVSVDQELNKAIHYYRNYYLVEYYYSQKRVVFYYTENFYRISSLLMEFFKYFLFYVSVEEGRFPLHSSCVIEANSHKAVLFVGNSGCGKSSNAILLALNEGYLFNNDEVTYISAVSNELRAIVTDDKVKICSEMFQQLLERGLQFEYEEVDGEYICDFKGGFLNAECNESTALGVSKIFLLKRDDSINNIEIFVPNIMQKGELIFPNMHISAWTTKEQRKRIIHMANCMMSKLEFFYIKYPTAMINDVPSLVVERLKDGV